MDFLKLGFKSEVIFIGFFDAGNLIVIENGFQKKSQKTPKQEIELALRIKKEYEQEKREKDGK